MSNTIQYKVFAVPTESVGSHNVLATEVGTKLRAEGVASLLSYEGTASEIGQQDGRPSYKEATDSASTAVGSTIVASFVFIKNTGKLFYNSSQLGPGCKLKLKVMVGSTTVSVLSAGEAILFKDDNANIDTTGINLRTVAPDGTELTNIGHLAVEFMVTENAVDLGNFEVDTGVWANTDFDTFERNTSSPLLGVGDLKVVNSGGSALSYPTNGTFAGNIDDWSNKGLAPLNFQYDGWNSGSLVYRVTIGQDGVAYVHPDATETFTASTYNVTFKMKTGWDAQANGGLPSSSNEAKVRVFFSETVPDSLPTPYACTVSENTSYGFEPSPNGYANSFTCTTDVGHPEYEYDIDFTFATGADLYLIFQVYHPGSGSEQAGFYVDNVVVSGGSAATNQYCYRTYDLVSGTEYTFSFTGKTDNASYPFEVYIGQADKSAGFNFGANISVDATGATEYSRTFTANSTGTAYIWIKSSANGSTGNFDNFKIK